MNTYVGVVFSDQHTNALPTKDYYLKEIKPIIASLYLFRKIDYILMLGDFFHSRVSMNSESGVYASKIMADIVKLAKAKNAKVRILKGTDSHDWNQLENFSMYESDIVDVDFRIIRTVEEEYLFHDMKVLYIPEEYVHDKDDYYSKYFNKFAEYDMILGHGLVEGALPKIAETESFQHNKHAPIFNARDFLCSKGPVLFGHIHTSMYLHDKVFYVGSLSRYCHGEEEPKGFGIILSTPEDDEYVIKFIENRNARTFKTINIGNLINGMKAEDIVNLIESYIEQQSIDYVRVRVSLLNSDEATIANLEIVSRHYNRNSHVNIEIDNVKLNKSKKDSDERVKKLVDTYNFLFDKNRTYQDKIKTYFDIRRDEILYDNEKLDITEDFITEAIGLKE